MKAKHIFILALLLTVSVSGWAETTKKAKKEIGLQLYSIRTDIEKNLENSLDSVAACGYSFIEAANYKDGKIYGMDPSAFSKMLESKGLKFISSHIGTAAPVATDKEGWDKAMAWWDQAIAAHKAAGVKYIVQPWMGVDAFTDLNRLQDYCNMFNEVGKKCNAAGIKFGYHNHSREFEKIGNTVIYDYMLAQLKPENVFFQLDVYWATKGGVKPVDYMTRYPGRFALLHIKDVKEIGASGTIDFKSIYSEAQTAGTKYCIVEQEDFDYPHFTSIKKSIDFMNNAPYIKKRYSK